MDDLTDKINSLLSDPDSMEKIKNLASMFSASSGGESPDPEPQGKNGSDDTLSFDPAMLLKIKKAFDLMNKDDPRIDLLVALKPNMSDLRRKKIDDAIHILRLLSIMPLLSEQGFF